LVALLPHAAFALPVARLKNVKPPVQVRSGGSRAFAAAQERAALSLGDTIRTGAGGKADVLFSNGTQVALRENSQIEIAQPESPSRPLVIRVVGALSEVFVRPKGNTQVRTAAAIAAARGTAYLLQLPTEDTAVLTVVQDTVDFSNPQGKVLVSANQQSSARVGAAPTPPVAVDVTGLIAWTADITGLPVEFEMPFISPDPNALKPMRGEREAGVRSNPNSAEAHQRLGEVLHDLGEFAAAVSEFEQAVRLAPRSASAHYGLGQAKRGQGDIPAAIAAYHRALQLSPNDAAPRVGLALAHVAQQNYPQARAALSEWRVACGEWRVACGEWRVACGEWRVACGEEGRLASPVTRHPSPQNDGRVYAVLALIDLHEGQPSRARENLQVAIQQDDKLYQAFALLALASLTQNQIPQAVESAQKAVGVQPNSAQTQGTAAMVFFFAKRPKDATKAAQKAAQLNPLSPFALLTQGRVLLSQLRVDEARGAYQQAQALSPNSAVVHNELGAIYLRLDRLPQAEQAYRRAVQLSPNFADAHTGLGVALQRQGRTQDALASHQQALQLEPNNATARGNLAALYIEEGQLDEARQQVEQGITAQPERGILYARLSEVYLLRQDYHTAQEFARRAVRLLPGSAVARYQLGRVYLEQNRAVQAEQEFRQAVTLDRNFADARFALGFTRAITETRRQVAPAPGATDLGSLARLISLFNLQAPGNEERLQAVIQDPTLFRIASRSYGDTQLDALAGEMSTQNFSLSHLRETGNRRGERGIVASRDDSDLSERSNTDETNHQIGVVFGQKSKRNPSGLFFLGQFVRQEKGMSGQDVGGFPQFQTVIINGVPQQVPIGATARRETDRPFFALGYNAQSSERRRTRLLFDYSSPDTDFTRLAFGSRASQDINNHSFEARHDVQADEKNLLSVGISSGRSRLVQDFLMESFIRGVPDRRSVSNATARTFQAYVRDEMKVNESLTLLGELQFQKVNAGDVFRLFEVRRRERLLDTVDRNVEKEVILPNFIAAYQPSPRCGIRFRARRLFGTVGDFQLLTPTDVFFTSAFADLIELGLMGTGRSFELEFDHTFGNASFLRVELFHRRLRGDVRDALTQFYPEARLRGGRASYEGVLNRDTTYFVNLGYNHAEDATTNLFIANVPRWTVESGLQFLNPQGWFIQPSYAYQGRRFTTTANRTQLGGYGVFNLRVGKRTGLRSVIFVELLNVFGKDYDIFFPGLTQPGATLRVGVTQRF
jgi:superkiller protein 3